MKVALWNRQGSPIEIHEKPIPKVEEDTDVVIRVRAAVFGAALVRAVTVGHPKFKPPRVLGTLVAGDVVSRGKNVDISLGTPVIVDPHPPCLKCVNCMNKKEALCLSKQTLEPGGLSEYVRIQSPLTRHIHKIPSGLSYAYAVYTEIVACVSEATLVSGISIGDTVVIIGCGPIAMIQIQLARLRGAAKVICLYNHSERESIISLLGAIPVDVREGFVEQRVKDLCSTIGADVVVEAVGSSETYSLSMKLVRPGGMIVLFGGSPPGTNLTIDPNHLHYNGIQLIGTYHYRPGLFERSLKLLASGAINLEKIITHRLPLEEVINAPIVAKKNDCIALIIEP